MTRYIFTSILIVVSFGVFAQANLRCELQACVESPSLFEFDGSSFFPIRQPEKTGEGVYEFQLPSAENRFYYVGANTQNLAPVILGQEEQVVLRGHCRSFRSAAIESPVNEAYQALKEQLNELQSRSSILSRQHQMAAGEGQDRVTAQLKALDEEKLALLEAMEKKDPLLGKVAAINTLLSYQNNGAGYENEIDYFANEYFHFVDFKDPAFQYLPWTFEGFRSYATTIISVGLPEEQQRAFLDGALAKLEKGGLAHKLALSGVIATLKQKNNGLFVYYAGQFVESFKDSDPSAAAGMQAQIEQMKSFVVGGQAPDFTQKTPDGGEMSLSDLRGKVVLLDFWASWCGPCRRENPNVVRMYEKYKEKGFDILGVSLDKTHDRWIQAIEQDGLEWHHVSDLKGWSNEAAQAYGVRSIPHTVLLDAEGRILARNLRGEALERKLEEIFD